MSGRDYLQQIRQELVAGRHQHRMGESILSAFGYVRRVQGVVDEINATLEELGLVANPPIAQDMPLRSPRIRFALANATQEEQEEPETEEQDDEEPYQLDDTPIIAFRVAELSAAKKSVECVPPTAPISAALTRMKLTKYSQLVVAGSDNARQQDIKGIISYRSISNAVMAGKKPDSRVIDCAEETSFVKGMDDIKVAIANLSEHDVVLVIGQDNRLQGIVTAWDLADEFAQLVESFKRIEEVEVRLRAVLDTKLGGGNVRQFLKEHQPSSTSEKEGPAKLTIGDIQRVIENPDNWTKLEFSSLHRTTFVNALDNVRNYRNRLMHFGDALSTEERTELNNFCDLVREVKATSPQSDA